MPDYINKRTALFLKKGVDKILDLEREVSLRNTEFKIASNIGANPVNLAFRIYKSHGAHIELPIQLNEPYQQIGFEVTGEALNEPLTTISITADADVHFVLHIDIPEEAKFLNLQS